jgi:hypothetical protein
MVGVIAVCVAARLLTSDCYVAVATMDVIVILCMAVGMMFSDC